MNWPAVLFNGHYALYVWGSYALTLMAMGGEVLLLLRRHRAQRDGTHDDAAAVSNQPPNTPSTPSEETSHKISWG